MKLLPIFAIFFLSPAFALPNNAQADAITLPTFTAPTFENLQNLTLTATIHSENPANTAPLTNEGTSSLPTDFPLSVSYSIDHTSTWPSRNASPQVEDELFKDTLSTNKLYLELWEGVPFTDSAKMLDNWDITGSSTGQVSATFPASGPYFLITYFPDGFYQDPQAECPNDPDWQEDCAPSYTLDQMRDYFTTPLDSPSSDPFPYLPDAFGGIEFNVASLPPVVSNARGSNVLFIPGTLTSRLYMKNPDGTERDLWEPRSNLDVPLLAMNADGTSEQTIYTRDIIDQLYSNDPFYHAALHLASNKDTDVYGNFESFLNSLVTNHTINEWRGYPYDWRYDVRDIVADGTLVGTATTSPTRIYLQDVVQELASTSATGKVTIVAHSNGGLIAKALAIDLAKKNELGLVDRIIMVGTPQFGTPKSITDLLHGDEFTQLGGLLMYSDTVRAAESTMPGAYDLMPSPAYFSHIQNPVVTFDTNAPANNFRNAIGAIINSFSQLSNFLSDKFNLDASAGLQGSPKTPIPLSLTLIQKAEATHDELDSWTPPEGVSVIAIAGWGNLTPYQQGYTGTSGLNCDRTSFFVPFACSLQPQLQSKESYSADGDDTVVAESAVGDIANTFYFDAKKLFQDTGTYFGHSSLLAAAPIQASIKNILTDTSSSSPYIETQEPSGGIAPLLVVSAHSPVNLLATDAEGNETGIVPVSELPGIYFEVENIPGSWVDVIGEDKYLYLPENIPFQISMTGYDAGTTTIAIGEMDSTGSTTITHIFPDIPTTASTTGEFTIGADDSVASDIPELIETDSSTTTPTTTSSQKTPSERQMKEAQSTLPLTTMTTSVVHFVENTVQPVTKIPELIQAFITIKTEPKIWVMRSTIFITFLRSAL